VAMIQVPCKVCGAALMVPPEEVGPFLCWQHDTDYHRERLNPKPTVVEVDPLPVPQKLAQAGPPQRKQGRPQRKMFRGGKMTPACRTMLSDQGGVCALCGVPGWGTHKGAKLKTGSVLKARSGRKVMGIFCRPCAAFIQKTRLRASKYCEAKRGPSGDGPRDQGGS
jgi:hypothetical protein